jgi:hypothetical protein
MAVEVAVAEASMEVAEVSIPAAVVAASTGAVELLAVAQAKFMAASLADRARSAEQVIPGNPGLTGAAIPAHWQITPRTFVPPSTMANGIRSATLEP